MQVNTYKNSKQVPWLCALSQTLYHYHTPETFLNL